jgi:hypothetical protein
VCTALLCWQPNELCHLQLYSWTPSPPGCHVQIMKTLSSMNNANVVSGSLLLLLAASVVQPPTLIA